MDNVSKIKYDTNIVVAIDFDNTIFKNGHITKQAIKYIARFKKYGCKIILWTSRHNIELTYAINLCNNAGIFFDYVNEYPLRESYPKINADIYIDDKNPCGVQWRRAIRRIKREIRMERNGSREKQFNKEIMGEYYNDTK